MADGSKHCVDGKKLFCRYLFCIISFALPCHSTVETECLFKHSEQQNAKQLVSTSMLLPHSKHDTREHNEVGRTTSELEHNVCFSPC